MDPSVCHAAACGHTEHGAALQVTCVVPLVSGWASSVAGLGPADSRLSEARLESEHSKDTEGEALRREDGFPFGQHMH